MANSNEPPSAGVPASAPAVDQFLAAAQAGSPQALGKALIACRGYLLAIARQELDPALRAKAGSSDLVQETLLEAQRAFPQFRGTTEGELRAWLRQILRHNIANLDRQFRGTAKRQLGREVSLDAAAPAADLPGTSPSPSAKVMADEQWEKFQAALKRLPNLYRTVIILRSQAWLSFDEIGRRMGRTPDAVRRMWARAIEQLQGELEAPDAPGSNPAEPDA